MNIIETKSFELAVNTKGNKNSEKIAIVLPGRLDTKDYACFDIHLEFLASKGFFAICFDPPGTWESPGGIELFTTTNYIKAVNELIGYFENKPTFLMGHSRGGTISILAGVSNPNVIGFSPIMATYGEPTPPDPEAIRTGVKISYRDLPPGTSITEEQRKFSLPINYFKDGEKYNVVDALEKCLKPKLLLYGINDKYTTPERVKEVFGIISEPKMIHELNSNHDYRYHSEIVEEVNGVVGQFLDTYILK